ncbi:hypothetical protein [Gardnerella vaginalis]|uniref:hypothetical protein n=1 Tax=Gardnerella vaginalis TaxID=2702 RepID=UPI000E678F3C|nr:hypothetical protein [Gardnerella vaginalis]RIY22916.1 hypothetical protein CJI55_05930 [Gardnerella vaginalis]
MKETPFIANNIEGGWDNSSNYTPSPCDYNLAKMSTEQQLDGLADGIMRAIYEPFNLAMGSDLERRCRMLALAAMSSVTEGCRKPSIAAKGSDVDALAGIIILAMACPNAIVNISFGGVIPNGVTRLSTPDSMSRFGEIVCLPTSRAWFLENNPRSHAAKLREHLLEVAPLHKESSTTEILKECKKDCWRNLMKPQGMEVTK